MSWLNRYVGLPFGEGPGEVTCWHLVRDVLADRGIADLPIYGEIGARDLAKYARAIQTGAAENCWQEVAEPQRFDVVLMSAPARRLLCHVGIVVAPGQMLHVEQASASVVVPLSHSSVRGRILGYRRYVA